MEALEKVLSVLKDLGFRVFIKNNEIKFVGLEPCFAYRIENYIMFPESKRVIDIIVIKKDYIEKFVIGYINKYNLKNHIDFVNINSIQTTVDNKEFKKQHLLLFLEKGVRHLSLDMNELNDFKTNVALLLNFEDLNRGILISKNGLRFIL